MAAVTMKQPRDTCASVSIALCLANNI